jgi:3alpha(or 20beta)-hydroxysteroid dehydrogenase
MRLEGKVALVTGGTQALGAAIVRRFLDEGAHVVFCGPDKTMADTLAGTPGGRACYIPSNGGDKTPWRTAVAKAEALYGALHIVVTDGGMDCANDTDARDFAGLTSRRIGSVFAAIQASLSALRNAGSGSIVNLLPAMGTEAHIGLLAFGTIGSGIRGMTRAAAIELGDAAIRVNSVQPGLIRLPGQNDNQRSGKGFGLIPLHQLDDADRAGQPQDVANAVLFLASDESSYITGADFVIDGGLSQCRNSQAGRAFDSLKADPWNAR